MNEDKTPPKRKSIRIRHYDYDLSGAYFVTICIKDRKRLLSHIMRPEADDAGKEGALRDAVGVGALDDPSIPQIRLTSLGRIVEKNLLSSERIPGVKIDRYVIMPDHIHAIFLLDSEQYENCKEKPLNEKTPANKMLPRIISVFKRFCNREIGENVFQRGYYEHIIRDEADHTERAEYILENPLRWFYGKMDPEEQ